MQVWLPQVAAGSVSYSPQQVVSHIVQARSDDARDTRGEQFSAHRCLAGRMPLSLAYLPKQILGFL